MKRTVIAILLISLHLITWAAGEGAGTTGFAFSRLLFSPRASAMGSAYAGIADDGEAIFYNPAGLFQIENTQINAIYMQYLEGINCGAVSFVKPGGNKLAYGIYSRFLSTTEERTLSDELGNYLGTSGTFGYSNIEAGGSFAYHFSQTLNVGGTVKLLHESIDGNSASAFAIDLGIYHITENENLHIGISLRNLGLQLSHFTESEYEEELPTLADLGFGFQLMPALLLAADIYKPFKGEYYSRFGLEIGAHEQLRLRIGYKSDGSDWRTGGKSELFAGFTGGFGVFWERYEINYAFVSYGDLGYVNQLGIKYTLDGKK
jgi:hypothetical protein